MMAKQCTRKFSISKSVLTLALTGSLFGAAAWNTDAHACPTDPYISSVCVMASRQSGSFDYYLPANGATVAMNQYQALYALIGTTYGTSTTPTTTFVLPDLRGKMIMGAGTVSGVGTFLPGQKGGNYTVNLINANLPAHTHTLATSQTGVIVTSSLGTMTASTTLTGLTATTTIGTLAANTNIAGLTATLNASSAVPSAPSPAGASLGTPGGTAKAYATTAPTTPMYAGSVTLGGSVNTSLTGAPSTTLSGTPTTTLNGAPSVTIAGQTGLNPGSSAPVTTLPPYLVMNYYIAVNGMYPSYN